MSNQRNKGNSGVNPVAIAAGVGLGALAAVGGYLFGRYQESCEAEAKAPPLYRPTTTTTGATGGQVQTEAHGVEHVHDSNNTDELKKPGRDRECIICFREFEDLMKNDEEIHTTPCGHVFCYKCIHKSLLETRKCPVCRHTVLPEHTLRIFL